MSNRQYTIYLGTILSRSLCPCQSPAVARLENDLRSRASRVLIQLAFYARVLFSNCTVNFREPLDLLRKSIRHRGKCRGSQCVPRRRCTFCGRSLWLKLLLFGRKLFEPQPSLTDGRQMWLNIGMLRILLKSL